jgi:hypothetical protein
MFKYIYLCVNNIKDYFYGGKHETDNFYDGYTGSSNSAEFKDDYNRGQIKPPQILFFHGDSNVILACEHFMLLSLKNAGFNLYNKNVGGGGAGVIDLSLVPDDFRQIIDDIIKYRKFPKIDNRSPSKIIADRALKKYLNGDYGRNLELVSTIKTWENFQPRHKSIVASHVQYHAEEMKRDLAAYQEKSTIVAIDDDRDNRTIKVEGTHRVAATEIANVSHLNASRIPFSEFMYDWQAVTNFCNSLNEPEQKRLHLTAEDLQMQMLQLATSKSLDIHSSAFEKECHGNFSKDCGGQWSPQQVTQNLRIVREKDLEGLKRKERNFFNPDKDQIKEIENDLKIKSEFKNACFISIASKSIMHSGIGAALHKLAENVKKKQCVIITRHSETDDEDMEDHYHKHFEMTAKIAGFLPTSNKWVFENTNGLSLKIFLIPSRVENINVGVRYWESYQETFDAIK